MQHVPATVTLPHLKYELVTTLPDGTDLFCAFQCLSLTVAPLIPNRLGRPCYCCYEFVGIRGESPRHTTAWADVQQSLYLEGRSYVLRYYFSVFDGTGYFGPFCLINALRSVIALSKCSVVKQCRFCMNWNIFRRGRNDSLWSITIHMLMAGLQRRTLRISTSWCT